MRFLLPIGAGLAALTLCLAPARAADPADCPELAAAEVPCEPPCSPAPCTD